MARSSRKQRRAKKRPPVSPMGFVERPDTNTLRVRTFWSPIPLWSFGAVMGLAGITISLLIAFIGNTANDDLIPVIAIGFVGGYFSGSILWAVVGAAGGDTLRLTLDSREKVGHVEQALLWIWRRDWTFASDEIAAVHHWTEANRVFLWVRFGTTHMVALRFDDHSPLALGRYPTEMEAQQVVGPLAEFLKVPIVEEKTEDPAA